jgi:large subunit ribosomal protein L3
LALKKGHVSFLLKRKRAGGSFDPSLRRKEEPNQYYKPITTFIMPGIVGKKIGMTRVIQDDGAVIPVTVISVPDAVVTHIKTADKDGYDAVVLGVEPLKKPTKTKKYRILKEFAFTEDAPEKDSIVDINILTDIASVSITAKNKGKGFSGAIKRHNFRSQPGSHGHAGKSKQGKRKTGSVGACAKPGRIKKGKKMPGQYGNTQETRHNIPVIKIDSDNKLLALKGAIPGAKGNTIIINF